MRASAIIGANFGDEGKGLMVDYLSSKASSNAVVVRFNGGAQAGHTVVTPQGKRHVFRHIGAGFFNNVPTFLSHFFVCNPLVFFTELNEMQTEKIELSRINVFADHRCSITTHVDILVNQHRELDRGDRRHGSCGLGFFETQYRNNHPELSITLGDLWNGTNIKDKLVRISTEWYKFRTGLNPPADYEEGIEKFVEAGSAFANMVHPASTTALKDREIIFEGAQGLLLDQNNTDFSPHLTRSNTGLQNVRSLCKDIGIDSAKELTAYYVTRSYLTRHGAGPLPNEDPKLSYPDNTNSENSFQGKLRFAPLHISSYMKRIQADAGDTPFRTVVTHTDQYDMLPKSFVPNFKSCGPTREDVSKIRSDAHYALT